MTRRMKSLLSITLAFLVTSIFGASAQTYPSRPVTFVVALPAGGAVDALMRVLADHMKATLDQPIIIENIGGAGGTIAIARIVRSAPDGYTIGMGTLGQYVIAGAIYPIQFDMLADLKPLIDFSLEIGVSLTRTALTTLGAAPTQLRSYTKAALVGTNGDLEHGAAMIHPAKLAAGLARAAPSLCQRPAR